MNWKGMPAGFSGAAGGGDLGLLLCCGLCCSRTVLLVSDSCGDAGVLALCTALVDLAGASVCC